MSGKHLFFYLIVALNLICWNSLFFSYLPLFMDGKYVFLLDVSSFGFISNDSTSKIEINPLFVFFFLFLVSIFTFILKFYFRERHILLLSVTFFSLLFSFGGVVSSLFLSSKINFLKHSILDEVSLGSFNLLSVRFRRTPEETWTGVCNYMSTNLKFSNLLDADRVNLYNYIMSVKPSMLESITFLNSLHTKRVELLSRKELVPIKSYGILDYLYPYFTADYYYLGFITTAIVSLGCFMFFSKTVTSPSDVSASLSKDVTSLSTDLSDLRVASAILKKRIDVMYASQNDISDRYIGLRNAIRVLDTKVSDDGSLVTSMSQNVFELANILENNTRIAQKLPSMVDKKVSKLEAKISTSVGIDAAHLNDRINGLRTEVNTKFGDLETTFVNAGKKLSTLETNVGDAGKKLSDLETKVGDVDTKLSSSIASLQVKFLDLDSSYDQHFDTLDEIVKSQEDSIASFGSNVTKVEDDLSSLKTSTALFSKDLISMNEVVNNILKSINQNV